MTRRPALEDFSQVTAVALTESYRDQATDDPSAEAARAATFEQGYQAGWDDATAAVQNEQTHIRSELAHNLQDIGFTFHEARAHVIRSIEPLLSRIVEKVVPDIIRGTFGQHVLEAALPLARSAANAPIEIVLAPASRPAIEPLLASVPQMSFVIREEPTLGAGQVYLRSGQSELSLDFSEIEERMASALAAFSKINGETLKHG